MISSQERKTTTLLTIFGRARRLLRAFFSLPVLSLRDIEQALHRLGILLASLKSNILSHGLSGVFLLILRTLDQSAYNHLINGTASDKQIIDKVFNIPAMSILRRSSEHERACFLFEAMVVIGSWEVRDPDLYSPVLSGSEMLKHCEGVIAHAKLKESKTGESLDEQEFRSLTTAHETSTDASKEMKHAKDLKSEVDRLSLIMPSIGLGFNASNTQA